MGLITLTTDWRSSDHFHGAVRGRILTLCPGATVVDLATGLKPFDLKEAAFVMQHGYPHFPEGTVHLCGVQSAVGAKPLLALHRGQYFILPDNGIIGMIFPDGPEEVFRLTVVEEESLFPLLDQMVPAACELLQGKTPAELGLPENEMKLFRPLSPTVEENSINGLVIHIDSYDNLVTNISRELFERVGRGRPFELYPGTGRSIYRITRLSRNYHGLADGDLFALFNSLDLLEIGMMHANAASLLGVELQSTVQITFLSK